MEDAVRERIISIIMDDNISINFISKGNKAFQRKLNRQIKEGAAITSETISTILEAFPKVSAEWLITGKGEKFKNDSQNFGPVRGEKNVIGNDIKGNIEFGNNINVSLPETGTQKIIKPDGTVELTSTDSSNLELENAKKEIEELRLTISHLKDNMSVKDELIASLKETIDLLKHRQ